MPVETTFKDYITESWSLDQMQMVENELMGLFRYTARMGWGENDTEMDARLVIFAGEIDPQLVHNHLIGTGWKYVESADPEDPTVMYKGYVRGSVDLLVKRGNLNIAAGVNGVAQAMPGHFIGIYADQIFSASDRYEDETMGDEGDTGEDETDEALTESMLAKLKRLFKKKNNGDDSFISDAKYNEIARFATVHGLTLTALGPGKNGTINAQGWDDNKKVYEFEYEGPRSAKWVGRNGAPYPTA